MMKREEAIVFFMRFILADCDRICVENPKGRMSAIYRVPDQYIDPYQFAASVYDSDNYYCKRTGLWLKNLPKLETNSLPRPKVESVRICSTNGKLKSNTWTETRKNENGVDRQKLRSKTAPGIAAAMAEQWGNQNYNQMRFNI